MSQLRHSGTSFLYLPKKIAAFLCLPDIFTQMNGLVRSFRNVVVEIPKVQSEEDIYGLTTFQEYNEFQAAFFESQAVIDFSSTIISEELSILIK